MKALTIKQPWASLIIYGIDGIFKDIESREWMPPLTLLGERIAIHSSRALDTDDLEVAAQMIAAQFGDLTAVGLLQVPMPTGCILGSVTLSGVVSASRNPWFFGKYGFTLQDPKQCTSPIPVRGALGFWTVPDEILKRIVEGVA